MLVFAAEDPGVGNQSTAKPLKPVRWCSVTKLEIATDVYVSLAGYVGLTVGWVEGFEVNFFGAVIGFDIRRPALKFPGLGRLSMAAGL